MFNLNDLHMFDLKSLMWLPLHCTGAGPSPRSNHVAALYDDRVLLIFGGSSKSNSLNDLDSLDLKTMIWSRIKVRGFHPSPRAGSCGVLCGTKWFIAEGGSRKKRHTETLVYDVLKVEWSVAVVSPPSVTINKAMDHRTKPLDTGISTGISSAEETTSAFDFKNSKSHQKQVNANILSGNDDTIGAEVDGMSAGISAASNIYQMKGSKVAALLRKNENLEGQLAAALAIRDAAERNLSSVMKSKHDMEKRLADTMKEIELLKEKVAGIELAQVETNSLSNVVHSDNSWLEHDVPFLKAVLDDTQKELHSTRGVLAGERARAFQLQVEVFHLKQRLQSVENRAATPRKPFLS